MNASQRRIIRRTVVRNLSALGYNPGVNLSRTPPKKTQSTLGIFVGVDTKNPRAVIVRRQDNRTVSWPLTQARPHMDARTLSDILAHA